MDSDSLPNMDTSNTIEYHLMALPTELRYRALYNRAARPFKHTSMANSPRQALIRAFYWVNAPEGVEFWDTVTMNLEKSPQP